MKTLALFLALTAAAFAADAPPKMPTELRLSNGAVLRNVSVVRWEADRVIVKHTGSPADPVFYRNIDESQRAVVLAVKNAVTNPGDRALTGEVFVATNGGQSMKLGSVTVKAFRRFDRSPLESAAAKVSDIWKESDSVFFPNPQQISRTTRANDVWAAYVASIPKGDIEAVTDADGAFTLNLKGGETYTIVAYGTRLLASGRERYLWIIEPKDVPASGKLILGSHNNLSLY